jgi:hypothetical protein
MDRKPMILIVAAWFLPGAGYLMQGKPVRAAIIAAVVWSLFVIAIINGGAYYPGFSYQDGQLLYLLNFVSRIGNGLGGFVSYFISAQPNAHVAALATFEYGGRFLEAAGLLNYLAVIDSVDIKLRRKA